jgi:hypothetical protein
VESAHPLMTRTTTTAKTPATIILAPSLLGFWARSALSVLFASCGIWLVAYCVALSHTGHTPFPIGLAWAWQLQVTSVFYRVAPMLWLALAAGPIYGTTGVVTIGCLSSVLYLATSLALLLWERVGVSLALLVSATSTLALGVENFLVAMNSKSRWHMLQGCGTSGVRLPHLFPRQDYGQGPEAAEGDRPFVSGLKLRFAHMKEPIPYKEAFPAGTHVRIADKAFLEDFMASWTYHHKLQPEQLAYAGRVAKVAGVAFYHGGDAIYTLEDTLGLWLEQCLQRA